MPIEHWSRTSHWWCWWCSQTLRSYEPPRQMISSMFLCSPWNSWECASCTGEVWGRSRAEGRSIALGMQYYTVGGRLRHGCTKGIQSPLEVHKCCNNGVGVGRWRVDHRSEHHQCLWLVAGALHHWVLLCIEARPHDRLIVLVHLW